MDISERLYTVQEFWEAVEQNPEKRFELMEGHLYEMSPSFTPSKVAVRIAAALLAFVDEHQLGHVTGADGGYQLSDDMLLIPDVAYISKERLPEIPPRNVPVPPDFAVEVFSPTDSMNATHRKAMLYIQHGTRLVWVVYPDEKIVDVYRITDEKKAVVETIDIDGSLDGGDVLPGFSLSVQRIFS